MPKSIYKSTEAKARIHALYQERLKSLNFPFETFDISSQYGRTRVMKTGNPAGKKVVFFHGVHAGSPLTLETVAGLRDSYELIALDTPGQATMSEEHEIELKDDSFALWADEVLSKMGIDEADFVGISYGAFILQKLITHRPQKVRQCILIVPSGLANGDLWPSLKKLTWPLLKFLMSKKDKHLKAFVKQFVPEEDEFMFRFQREILTGMNMDYRRPNILQEKDVASFNKPVYLMVAEHDVFFPAQKTITKAKEVFSNLIEVHCLKDSKHMPAASQFMEITTRLKAWID